jgi:hypothetical protein
MARLPIALIALLSLAAVVVATPADFNRPPALSSGTPRNCGSHITPDVASKKEEDFASRLANAGNITAAAGNFTIPVNFNIIYTSTDISGGYVP